MKSFDLKIPEEFQAGWLTNPKEYGNILGVSLQSTFGEMSEWFKELVLKTSDPARGRGFESHSLRHFFVRLDWIWRSTQEAEGAPLLRE